MGDNEFNSQNEKYIGSHELFSLDVRLFSKLVLLCWFRHYPTPLPAMASFRASTHNNGG
jgi:hypothetical protein